MTTTKQHGTTVFMCDACHHTEEPPGETFQEMWVYLKTKLKWRTEKIKSDWFHYCGDCR